MDALVVEGLSKRYGRTTSVDGLSFAAGSGPNGAGKTTTLRIRSASPARRLAARTPPAG